MCKKLVLSVAIFLICFVQAYGQEDPNLVAYWNFDDGAVTDLSGNSNNGMRVGGAGLNNDPNWAFGGDRHVPGSELPEPQYRLR